MGLLSALEEEISDHKERSEKFKSFINKVSNWDFVAPDNIDAEKTPNQFWSAYIHKVMEEAKELLKDNQNV